MKISVRDVKNCSCVKFLFLLLLFLGIDLSSGRLHAQAPRITYVYDDLGRLVRVIDESGNAATYHYDAVGNILRITRETGVPNTATITSVSPTSLIRGTTTTVTLSGYNLQCSPVSSTTEGVTLSIAQFFVDQIVFSARVSNAVAGAAAYQQLSGRKSTFGVHLQVLLLAAPEVLVSDGELGLLWKLPSRPSWQVAGKLSCGGGLGPAGSQMATAKAVEIGATTIYETFTGSTLGLLDAAKLGSLTATLRPALSTNFVSGASSATVLVGHSLRNWSVLLKELTVLRQNQALLNYIFYP